MTDEVELDFAWTWDCAECGHINFVKAVDGVLDEETKKALGEDAASSGIAVIGGGDPKRTLDAGEEKDMVEVQWLLPVVVVMPKYAKCEKCLKTKPVKMPEHEEE